MATNLQVNVLLDRASIHLIQRAAVALFDAQLDESLEDLADRMVRVTDGNGARRCLRYEPASKSEVRIGLEPFAELALLDVIHIAESDKFDNATKARIVSAVLTSAGY